MKPALALLTFASVACRSAPSPSPVAPPPAPPAAAATVSSDPRHQTFRQRIEGYWQFDSWLVRHEVRTYPEVGGIFSLSEGIATFQLNLRKGMTHIFCIGYYNFTENDTVLTIGWNQCSKWKPREDGAYTADFGDEWDGFVPVFKIEELPGGDLSLKYNTNNEHGRVVQHGGPGWDMTFKTDETLEYWNLKMVDGIKDNVKHFRKLHGGDPKLQF